jgi:hypothetical protein
LLLNIKETPLGSLFVIPLMTIPGWLLLVSTSGVSFRDNHFNLDRFDSDHVKVAQSAEPANSEAVARLLPEEAVVMTLALLSARSVPPPSLPFCFS